jgi:hypothetical protein
MRRDRLLFMQEGAVLSWLALAYAKLGDARARDLCAEAVSPKRARADWNPAEVWLNRARALRELDAKSDAAEIEAALAEATRLAQVRELRSIHPFVQIERAELARLYGDPARAELALREAQILFAEIGAVEHSDRIARELAE